MTRKLFKMKILQVLPTATEKNIQDLYTNLSNNPFYWESLPGGLQKEIKEVLDNDIDFRKSDRNLPDWF